MCNEENEVNSSEENLTETPLEEHKAEEISTEQLQSNSPDPITESEKEEGNEDLPPLIEELESKTGFSFIGEDGKKKV
jgi:hypothetical protein